MLINFVTLKAAVVGSVLSVGAGPSGIITSEYLHTYPMEAMGETNGVGFLKDVLILDGAPYPQRLSEAKFNSVNLDIVHQMRDYRFNYPCLSRSKSIVAYSWRQKKECMSGAINIADNGCPRFPSHVIGRCLATIFEKSFRLEPKTNGAVLFNGVANYYGQIRPKLSPRRGALFPSQSSELPCDIREQKSSDAGNSSRVVFECSSDLPSRNVRYVVNGTIFFAGVFVFLAYFAIKWSKP